MRISERHVVSLVDGQDPKDDRLVFVDDSSKDEFVVERALWPLLQLAVTYLTGNQYAVEVGEHEHQYLPVKIAANHQSVPTCSCGAVGGPIGEKFSWR